MFNGMLPCIVAEVGRLAAINLLHATEKVNSLFCCTKMKKSVPSVCSCNGQSYKKQEKHAKNNLIEKDQYHCFSLYYGT
uniref:Uncharacterized protein n=1 Tax=Rhizophora mucronata TaxID=61149 RepID=A0A2P2PK58_RHIMU